MNNLKIISTMIIGLFITLSCGKEVEQQEIIRPVRYMQVYSTGGSRVRTFTGVAQAGIETRLSFKVPGTVKQLPVTVGDSVSRGQLIAELDANDYQVQVQQAEAALAQAQAQERNASASYNRVRALYENNNASRSDLDAARAGNESAAAAVRAAEKQLELASLQLSYTRLSAPVDGDIAAVNIERNENVGAGQPIIILTSGKQIEVKLAIPEILIPKVEEGGPVTVTFDALPEKKFSGEIIEVGVVATGLGTSFPVIVRLDETDDAIRPGMAASVSMLFESTDERERFIVPSHAVAEDRNGRFVYVVEPSVEEQGFGFIRRKTVVVGELTADGLEIFEGLNDGDLVVTAGISRVVVEQKVKI